MPAGESDTGILPRENWEQLLTEWNQTSADYPREVTIHMLFEQRVEQSPNTIAVECSGTRLTYRELNQRADALSAELQKQGVEVETRVGIYVERSLDMIVGVLGILKAGGAYVPLDPHFPEERLVFMIADAQIQILVTQHGLEHQLPEHRARVVCVDALNDVLSPQLHRACLSSASICTCGLYPSTERALSILA